MSLLKLPVLSDEFAFNFANDPSEAFHDLDITTYRDVSEEFPLVEEMRSVLCFVNFHFYRAAVDGDYLPDLEDCVLRNVIPRESSK